MSTIPNELKAIKPRPDGQYTDEEKRIVADLLKDRRISGAKIAEYLNLHYTTPSRWKTNLYGTQQKSSNMGKRSRYSPHFKLRIIKRVTEGGESISQVAREIGSSDSVIHGWKKNIDRIMQQAHETPKDSRQDMQAQYHGLNGQSAIPPDQNNEELNFLKQKLSQLQDENETLLKTLEILQRRLQAYRDRYGQI